MFRKKKNNTVTRRPAYIPPAEVFSYHARRSASPSNQRLTNNGQPPQRKLGPGRWLRLLPTILSLGAIIVSLFYATSLSTKPRLQINGSGNGSILRETTYYEDAAARILEQSILNYNKLTINTTKLAQDLSTRYPELGSVAVIIPLSGHRPVIEVKPAVPVMTLSGNGGIFIVDEQGRALLKTTETTFTSSSVVIPHVIDQSGLELQPGKEVLPLVTINFIRELTIQLQTKGFQIESITLPPLPSELHLRLQGLSYFMKFNTQSSAREQAGTFIAAQEKLKSEGTVVGEYIDVRVPEKGFYR